MITNVRKWGNSLALRIPAALAREARVEEGAAVDLTLQSGCLVIAPRRKIGHNLASLLDQVTPENLHAEIDSGAPRGREEW